MKRPDYHQGPFIDSGQKPSGGPFVGGRGGRAPKPSVSPQPAGHTPKSRGDGPKRGFVAWRHILVAVLVAGGIAIVRAGVETTNGIDIDVPDFSSITSTTDITTSTVEVPKLSDRPDTSEDPKVKTSSQIVTVDSVTGNTVRVRNILGRELTWRIKCPAVRQAIVAATGDKPILSWERDASGAVVVRQVLGSGKIVQC